MEERKPTLKILYENTEKPVNQVWLTFPFSDRETRAEDARIDKRARGRKQYLI